MSKWRKLPVIIDAFMWTGGPDQTEDPEWIIDAMHSGTVYFENEGTPYCCMLIKTLEGKMRGSQGDYIIKGVNGEIYPCKPEIFEKTYEPA